MTHTEIKTPRVAAIVGSFGSGKTALLESFLSVTGAVNRKGAIADRTRFGDATPEAKEREMSVESVIAQAAYLGEDWVFIDTPGSVEFMHDSFAAMTVADVAVVVVDPDPARAVMVTPILKFLSGRNIPHMIFINKVEHPKATLEEVMAALKNVSDKPLVLREYPLSEGEHITGYINLTTERAYLYADGEYDEENHSCHKPVPDGMADLMELSRQEMLEAVADYDDMLLEQLLEESVPTKEEIYEHLRDATAAGHVVPVFFGAAEKDEGVMRLLKVLRHEIPDSAKTAKRLGLGVDTPSALVFKTLYAQHTGKQSIARIFGAPVTDGAVFGEEKVSGLYAVHGTDHPKIASCPVGGIASLGHLENVATGMVLHLDAVEAFKDWPSIVQPTMGLSVHAAKKGDEVKLTGALTKLTEEDPSLQLEQNQETGEMCLWGQGEIHLKVALSLLDSRFHVIVEGEKPTVPYKETIKKSVKVQGRHKKQSGGAGQFGDVHVEIKPLARGEGFTFASTVVGGSVPKQYIPAVETGIKEYLTRGVLGFPVVDISTTLYDGSAHSVDSSDQAFKMAGILAMREGMPDCSPTLLEPILAVDVSIPTEFTSGAQRVLTQRRGQILGFEQKEGWDGWDILNAQLPQAEMNDLIIDLRSLTMGVGTFEWQFDHLQELSGREAEHVIAARKEALEKK